jgi:L-rhamnose isomerase / sugar isomerase
MDDYRDDYRRLEERLSSRGIDLNRVQERLKAQAIETPSWGYADSGTRFGVFAQPGAAVTIVEKLEDAAQVHRHTGIAPLVATHVLWDMADDPAAVIQRAKELGVRIGSINPNCFQDRDYWLGSITHSDPAVRQKAVDHMLWSVELGKRFDSELLSLWFADGTDYPGQGDFRRRKRWAEECLKTVYDRMPPKMRMLVEYKPFEPGFYHTDLADWGMAYTMARKCGDRAFVLVDLGHHLHGQNIEHLVAYLLDEGMLGGFRFNNRKYADDDLTVGSINPYELFLIYHELAKAEEERLSGPPVAYMVDQAFNAKKKIPGMIQTIVNIQTAYAKALIVDRKALAQAQAEGDVVSAESALQTAFETDVTSLLKTVRQQMGVPEEPLKAYLASGYQQRIEQERGIRAGAGGLGQ